LRPGSPDGDEMSSRYKTRYVKHSARRGSRYKVRYATTKKSYSKSSKAKYKTSYRARRR
jgi:hypothetical protein